MEKTLTNFIRSLRNAEIRVSTAETLDALSAVELVGYRDKDFLKDSFKYVLLNYYSALMKIISMTTWKTNRFM